MADVHHVSRELGILKYITIIPMELNKMFNFSVKCAVIAFSIIDPIGYITP